MAKLKEPLNPRNHVIRQALLVGGFFIVGFILLAIAGIQLWEWSNSPSFCSNICHDVHPEETAAYQDSYHARIRCVECHIGRVSTLRSIALKASHLQHLPQTVFRQYEHPKRAETLRPASESCERCHWPPAFHYDSVVEIRHFEPDEYNTERRTYLILKTGGGEKERGLGHGIHWHIVNPVEYIATDEYRQDIRWVRVTLPDGQTVHYSDVTNPLSTAEIAEAETRTMDCVDCHNQVGHPFHSPEQLVDFALAERRLSTDLPFIKEEMQTLVSASYRSQAEGLAAADFWAAQYKARYPEAAAKHAAEIGQAAKLAKELLTRLVFEEPGITWQSFPDNSGHGGHKDFPGCFRCHDGGHLSAQGESIRAQCNMCHSIPMNVTVGNRAPDPPVRSIQEPASHLEANFMADHRFQASEDCEECHGEIVCDSADDSSFCANSACHGQAWPGLDLDAALAHPVPMEGKHTELRCCDCHYGEEKPVYQCASCHEPPAATRPSFKGAITPSELRSMPLIGAHLRATCNVWHTDDERVAQHVCTDCHPPLESHPQETCETCHTPEGWADSAASLVSMSPQISHALDGLEDCLACHAPAADTKPVPADHQSAGYINAQCQLCHEPTP